MMKKIALLGIFVLAVSCDLQYDGDTRLVIEGNLVDKNGNPMVGKYLEIVTSDGNDTDLISNTTSDANGHILMIFPKPSDYNTHISVKILEDANTLPKVFLNMTINNFIDYKFVIPKPVLHYRQDVATLNLHFAHNDSTFQLIDFTVEGTEADLINDYHPEEVPVDFTYFVPDNQYFMYKNQDVIVHYHLMDYTTSITTEYTETITIGNDAVVNYTIAY